jgi:hypothetical protein
MKFKLPCLRTPRIVFDATRVLAFLFIASLAFNAYLFLQVVQNTSNDMQSQCYLSTKMNMLVAEQNGIQITKTADELQEDCLKVLETIYPKYGR